MCVIMRGTEEDAINGAPQGGVADTEIEVPSGENRA